MFFVCEIDGVGDLQVVRVVVLYHDNFCSVLAEGSRLAVYEDLTRGAVFNDTPC
jgi:hypothetical protein